MTEETTRDTAPFFRFEEDFAGSLRCIPMIVRLKLDLCTIKLSLRQWSRIPAQEREALVTLPCDTVSARTHYESHLIALIATFTDEPLKRLQQNDQMLWKEASTVPACIIEQAAKDGVDAPSLAQWSTLTPLKRFALVKLARSKHENMNFVPALREFDLFRPKSAA